MFAEVFLRDANKSITVLEKLLKTGDLNQEENKRTYVINMHGIKSALANVGRMDLSDIALKLEQAGRDGDIEMLNKETPAFLDSLKDCVAQLKPKEKQSAETTDEDKLYLKEQLLKIKTACEEFDEDSADESLTELRLKAWPWQTMQLLEVISEKLLHSDFSEIVSDITVFLEQEG
jgi:HPt (histidine-containing phosphotransfer) domain-containing protein